MDIRFSKYVALLIASENSSMIQLYTRLGLSWFAHREQGIGKIGRESHPIHLFNLCSIFGKKSSYAVPASTIREAARSTAMREIASQKTQYKPFGIMADWNQDASTYRTLGR